MTGSGWRQFNEGHTLGEQGSEHGNIVRDEMFNGGVRITLERGTTTSAFAITAGITNWLVHTVYVGTEESAQRTFELMKEELVKIAGSINREPFTQEDSDLFVAQLKAFIHRFV